MSQQTVNKDGADIKLDISKLITNVTPDFNVFTAIERITKLEHHIIDAYWIMQSVLENRDENYWEFHEKRMRQFMSQFEKS